MSADRHTGHSAESADRHTHRHSHKYSPREFEEPESHLYREINELRHPTKHGPDPDAVELARLNDTCFGKLAANKKFEYTTLSVIVLNAGWIGYDADFSARNGKPADLYDCGDYAADSCLQFMVAENFFAVYFTVEVFIRFWSYRRKCSMFSDLWFLFDSTLVMFMIIETWILPMIGASGSLSQLSVLRLLRLLRITRMAKLMRFFPELQIIVKGMFAAVRSVVCTAVLLIMILYVWAIIFTSEFHQGDVADDDLPDVSEDPTAGARALFGSMTKSMRHLFIMGTILDDLSLCCNSIRTSGKQWTMMTAFVLFILLSSFTMLNMLIGILCEVVCATGEGERQKNSEMTVREAITTLFHKMDKDSNGEVTREEFLSMKSDKHVMKALAELDVKAKHFEMYADLMFKPEDDGQLGTMDFEETIDMIMRLRPGTKVSALDFASFQTTVEKNYDSLAQTVSNIEKMTTVLTGKEFQDPDEVPHGSKSKVSAVPSVEEAPEQEILAELQRRIGSFSGVEAWPEKQT